MQTEKKCRSCDRPFIFHMTEDGETNPRPEDLSVCSNCGTLSKFDSNLDLVPLTDQEIHQLRNHDRELWADLLACQGMTLSRKN